MLASYIILFLHFCIAVMVESTTKANNYDCDFNRLLNPVAHSILCAVEKGVWRIPSNATSLLNVGCLLGKGRCEQIMHVPRQDEVPPSPSPPSARNAKYQELATIAEKVVPKTWWRDGFADDKLLLSHNNDDLPRKQFDARSIANKKLKNIYQCVTRQQFMRKSFNFQTQNFTDPLPSGPNNHCSAHLQLVVKKFHKLWLLSIDDFDGRFTTVNDDIQWRIWFPKSSESGQLLMAALETLDHFFTHYGGVWTGCFAYEKITECRGALAG